MQTQRLGCRELKLSDWLLAELELNTDLLKDKSMFFAPAMLTYLPLFLFILYYHPLFPFPLLTLLTNPLRLCHTQTLLHMTALGLNTFVSLLPCGPLF